MNQVPNSKTRKLLAAARVASRILSPVYLPLLAYLALLSLSYLQRIPLLFRAYVLFMVWLGTVVMPRMGLFLYQRLVRRSELMLPSRRGRIPAYTVTLVCYMLFALLLHSQVLPSYMRMIMDVGIVVLALCLLVNFFVKVSTHAAGWAAAVGGLMSFSFVYAFPVIPWICVLTLLCGLAATSRYILRVHTLSQIGISVLLGFFSALLTVAYY